jgi:GLPGLI family protein
VYYTNIKNNENITKLNAYGELFLIKSDTIHWQLTNETQKIGKYLCNKATTEIISKGKKSIVKHPITVWYAPAIPVHFGPLGYYGLPGLILKLEISDISYYASKIELNSTKIIKIKKPTHGKVVTKKEFDEISTGTMKNFKKNFKNLH